MNSKIIQITLIVLFINNVNNLQANDINDYFQVYRTTGKSVYQTEKDIIESYKLSKLIEQLAPFYNDSIEKIRLKAYYFTYKKGIQEKSDKSNIAITQLLNGCFDENGGVVGRNLEYLQEFPSIAFSAENKNQIKNLLSKRQIIHLKKIALLAGYAGAASDVLQQQLLLPDISKEKKWAFSLALARQGNADCIDFCVNSIKNIPINNDLIYYIIPDMIYLRQKEAINYCIEILNNDEKLCISADPDNQKKILCGYYLLELLAPVIIDLPIKTDGTGSLITNNYEAALVEARSWFKTNPEYKLNKEIF